VNEPKRIRILGKYYKIIKDSTPLEDSENVGLTDIQSCQITFLEDQDPQQQRDTIIHECVHAIEETMGLDLTEEQVLGLGGGIYALMIENPNLIKWIMHKCPRL